MTHVAALLALASTFTSGVYAGCGDVSVVQAPLAFSQSVSDAVAAEKITAAARVEAAGAGQADYPTVAGLWKFRFTSLGNTAHSPSIPDGATIDFGYQAWHSDGTEIQNSGGRTPATGNFCMGTWGRTGPVTYQLNHFGLGYDAGSGLLTSISQIRVQITIGAGGTTFTGTFTIDVSNPTTGARLDHLAGTVTAQKVTVDQATP